MKNLILVCLIFGMSLPVSPVKAEEAAAAASAAAPAEAAGAANDAAAMADVTAPVLAYTSVPGKSKLTTSQGSIESCHAASQSAKSACLANLSPKIQGAAAIIAGLLGTIGMSKSSSETCSKYNNAMKIAETALLAYNTMCTAMQASCETACGETKTTLAGDEPFFSSQLSQYTAQANNPATAAGYKAVAEKQIALIGTDQESLRAAALNIGNKLNTCRGYKWNLAAAGMGLTNVLKQSAAAKECEKATTVADCTKDPYNPACAKTMDCAKAENYQQTHCICQRTPTAAGCGGYAGSNNNMPSVSSRSTGQSADTPNMPLGGPTDSVPIGAAASGGTGASSLGGGSGGGAGAGGGGFGVGNGTGKVGGADSAKKDKGLNANILGGFDGGGGGGGGSRSSASVPNSAYKDYLPGGKKDPSGATVQVYGDGQVTGSGSKSNWEKVSERYSEAKSSLVRP
ncbi:MAG: hypothetical protein ACXWC9_00480 [Pseudobdellovibrionaceae bacterium]